MDFKNQIELELYFADHFDTIIFPVLADLYFKKDDLVRARKVCDIGLKYHENNSAGLFILAQIEKSEGNLKKSEKLLEKVLLFNHHHFAAAEMLCEIQTVLGRATKRLLRSWKHVYSLDSAHSTARDFINKVGEPNDNSSKILVEKQIKANSDLELKGSETITQENSDLSSNTPHDISDPMKVSPRLATFTYVSVLKNQGLFSQALEVLKLLEEKGESLEAISLERDTIQALIENQNEE